MSWTVDFQGGPVDRWHRWTVVDDVRDAGYLMNELLTEKGVHAVAVTDSVEPAAWGWRNPPEAHP